MHSSNPLLTLVQGITGVSGSALAYTATVMETAESYMRILSIMLGLVVAVMTILKLSRDLARKK